MRAQLEQIDIARRLIAKYPNDLGFATSVADIRREMSRGRIASLLGIEGGHTIDNSLGALRMYYDLGVRYMTLTHSLSSDWADAATGLLFIDESGQDMHAVAKTVHTPLIDLPCEQLCPGNAALQTLMERYR